jgi:hypothetical protein
MKTRKTVLTLSLALVLVVGGLVVASNMGFKFVPNLSVAGADFWVSVPYNNNYTVADDVCTDIGPNATLVSRFDTSSGLRQDWTCPFGNNFSITSGEGLFIRVSGPTTPTVVGSHDPTLAIPQGGFTVSGRDWFLAIPYHTTAAVADDICGEVGPNATLVSRFDTGSGLRQDWTCPFGNNFTINIGEALAVRVGASTPAFVPAHY